MLSGHAVSESVQLPSGALALHTCSSIRKNTRVASHGLQDRHIAVSWAMAQGTLARQLSSLCHQHKAVHACNGKHDMPPMHAVHGDMLHCWKEHKQSKVAASCQKHPRPHTHPIDKEAKWRSELKPRSSSSCSW